MKAFFRALGAAAVLASPAWAADPFTVAKVPVDARGATAIEAQTRAVQQGYQRAARQLMERLTLEGERAEKGLPELSLDVIGPLVRGQTTDNERRSNTRYLGDLTIAFNPSGVQRLLRERGLTLVSSQAQERLVVPVDVGVDSALGQELLGGRHAHSLTPLRTPRADEFRFAGAGLDTAVQGALRAAGLQSALIVRPGRITEVGVDGTRRTLPGSLSGAVAQLEREWKQSTAVPSGTASTATVSILYGSLADWQRLQRAINTASQVRDARLDAVSKDGALMTLSYGDFARLQSEMRQKGVIVERDPELGIVIRG